MEGETRETQLSAIGFREAVGDHFSVSFSVSCVQRISRRLGGQQGQ
jgi:hypothetical protein